METGNNRPQGHKKKVGQGSVSVGKTEKVETGHGPVGSGQRPSAPQGGRPSGSGRAVRRAAGGGGSTLLLLVLAWLLLRGCGGEDGGQGRQGEKDFLHGLCFFSFYRTFA